MSITTQPPKTFDLPKQHLYGPDYVPPKTRDSDERERRHQLPNGTVLLESQQRGLEVLQSILPHLDNPEDVQSAVDFMAAALMNSSWYSYGQHADVMRRRLELATLADDTGWRQTPEGLLARVTQGLMDASELASIVTRHHVERRPRQAIVRKLGHVMGNVSLDLVGLRIGHVGESVDPVSAQLHVREESIRMLGYARTVGDRIGTHPSVAQFADQDSDVLVAWRREATDGAYRALEAAFAEAS